MCSYKGHKFKVFKIKNKEIHKKSVQHGQMAQKVKRAIFECLSPVITVTERI